MSDNFDMPLPVSPEMSVAGLPTTLIAAGLYRQLDMQPKDYTDTDYLTPLMDSVIMLRERHKDDVEILNNINSAIRLILDKIVIAINREFNIELGDFGVDRELGSYESDVRELYHFFIIARMSLARDLLAITISNSRRRYADMFRKSVEKRNQTTAEARRNLAQFDDVVIFVSIGQIVESLVNESNWGYNLSDSVQLLNLESSSLIMRIANYWDPDSFAEDFCKVALVPQNRSNTVIDLASWWFNASPKKTSEEKDSSVTDGTEENE